MLRGGDLYETSHMVFALKQEHLNLISVKIKGAIIFELTYVSLFSHLRIITIIFKTSKSLKG